MKCFERLVKSFITSSIPDSLDPLQFAYRPNRSTEDAIALTLHHTALSHLDQRDTYLSMLFIDYSSAFNTIVPSKLVTKLRDLGLNSALCDWILNFLTGWADPRLCGWAAPHILHPDSEHRHPQGCVLSPLLYSLFTHDCMAAHSSNTIIKFADDTTVIGLITGDDETAYREEVRALTSWCQDNNLHLNVSKTKELIVDFRRRQREEHAPLSINGTTRWRESTASGSSGFTSARTSPGLITLTSSQRSARQRLFFLRRLQRLNMDSRILCSFYRVAVYVDCPAGTLSFYRVSSDTLIHLHTFNTTFTEPLYPGFGLFWSSAREASQALLGLRQRSRRVIDYAIEFCTLVADSGWNPPANKDAFVNGLNEGIKDQLAPHEIPEHFEGLVDFAVRIDNRLQEREAERPRSSRRSSEVQGAPWGFWEFHHSTGPTSAGAEVQALSSVREEPMQLGRTRLVPEDRQRCLREGACFYCSQSGHRVGSCPLKEEAHQVSPELVRTTSAEPVHSNYPDISKVPPCYHDLYEIFNKAKATSLPQHRHGDCAIDLLPGASIPKALLYAIFGPERKAM
ncbi:hypothetical protein L3Q82_001522 [Scortum barcoo]|uniref:Uncharacterized protein n=1 Tax=Scortum barcoo TaxID=214431 RepID=A0ACB8W873_9TELE|nr:hypothetical protein L3Q82_001522 [Scortum barcoo]